ncbi:PP2C family protein-serine/threonine phosphatase [Paenibacillus popilliae]|uniref:Serine/threonine protein phosphatase n=1 Tax=Paenibacillus popilliae ATCC 14706 TaxID=1212764 RepID=M9LFQ6_PAEPP|nr:protein phosphatase 2C domain-containing protein [Paenibacillus popilliae]GAC41170.1 serine/threonine protein phosphatase [Paenibacillus popilliae ATCC 14706]
MGIPIEFQEWMPYIIVLGAAVAILLLIGARRHLLAYAPADKLGVPIGNGQTIGAQDEQGDYFSSATTPYGTTAVVADGISGLAHGRLASTIAVTVFIREFLKLSNIRDIHDYFTKAAKISNSEILQQLRGAPGGTTLVAGVIAGDRLYWAAVGDSVIMVFRDGEFIWMNEEHALETVLKEHRLAGELTRGEVIDYPRRKRLINYLGYEHFARMEVGSEPFALRPGDRIILCSDGVYNTMTEVELEAILSQPIAPNDAAEEIIAAIEAKGLAKQDNATIVIVDHD